MGIRGLEKFIKIVCPHIAEEISIRDEIEKWRREHAVDPTIVVDLKEFLRVFVIIDEGGLILGGRPDLLNDIFEYFFGEIIKSRAKLIFIGRLNWGRSDKLDEYLQPDRSFDCIEQHKPLARHLANQNRLIQSKRNTLYSNERLWYNVMALCKKYGQVVCSYGWGRGTTLLHVRQQNAMALITRDTEFLVYEGDFQFWTMSDVDYREMKITRFCRQKLHEALNLNTQQMKLLYTMCQYEPKSRAEICGNDGSFIKCVSYVKRQKSGPEGYDVTQLTGQFTDEQVEEWTTDWNEVNSIENHADSEREHLLDEFLVNLTKIDADFNLVFQFCKNRLYFVFRLMSESVTVPRDILYVDLRKPDSINFLNMMNDITLKLCGIIFKDIDPEIRPKTRTVYVKSDENVIEKGESVEMGIKYPPNALLDSPSFRDLIILEDDEKFTNFRWSLFTWLLDIDDESLAKIKKSSDSKHIRLVLFTQKILLKNQLITHHEADVILLTESDSQTKSNVYVPKNRPPPPMPNDRFPSYVGIDWVITAHKYTIAFELVCHCLEMCGLRNETSLIVFNALKFHESMHLAGKNERDFSNMLHRIDSLRLE